MHLASFGIFGRVSLNAATSRCQSDSNYRCSGFEAAMPHIELGSVVSVNMRCSKHGFHEAMI